jgi:hypothetical protein
MPTVWWLLFVVMLVGLVIVPLGVSWGAEAQQPARESPLGATVQSATRLGEFPLHRLEIEEVYVQQSLHAMYVLGWDRGVQWDSYVDWRMGMEYTFWPWGNSGWRDAWAKTPGERFAEWWVGYCVINCDNYRCDLGEGACAEVEAELAAGFDVALSGVTER